jgi:hypothetical protein
LQDKGPDAFYCQFGSTVPSPEIFTTLCWLLPVFAFRAAKGEGLYSIHGIGVV